MSPLAYQGIIINIDIDLHCLVTALHIFLLHLQLGIAGVELQLIDCIVSTLSARRVVVNIHLIMVNTVQINRRRNSYTTIYLIPCTILISAIDHRTEV